MNIYPDVSQRRDPLCESFRELLHVQSLQIVPHYILGWCGCDFGNGKRIRRGDNGIGMLSGDGWCRNVGAVREVEGGDVDSSLESVVDLDFQDADPEYAQDIGEYFLCECVVLDTLFEP